MDNNKSIAPPATKTFKARALKFFVASSCIASAVASSSLRGDVDKSNDGPAAQKHMNFKTFQPLKFHQSGFGALNYNHEEDSHDKFHRVLANENVVVPESPVWNAIPSLTEKNIVNLYGHYVHDEHRSPYASPLYDRPTEELAQEQTDFLDKMEKVRQDWGSWNFKDQKNIVRPVQDFSNLEYKDLPNSDFLDNVWQKDETYIKDLISEGRALMNRMEEGIYAELGYPTKKADGSTMSAEEKERRDEIFKVHLYDGSDKGTYTEGVAHMSNEALDGLARKLLHSMITNDEFYFVLGGHSAAAGHGNDFHQQKTMQFHYIMEPVFQKLGMRLMSRNMAMGGLGTLHFSAGMADLYGESDFLMWDSAMTESHNSMHDIDLFNKQAILKGERVPIIFTLFPINIMDETGGKAWIGDIMPGFDTLPETTSVEQAETLPWAVRFQNCADGVALCGGSSQVEKFNAVCWVDRKDYTPVQRQAAIPRGQASWHPGWRWHQFNSRQAALVFVKAFNKAFDIWEEGMKTDGFPLKESYWHVGDTYKDVQDTLRTYINGVGKGNSVCEKRYAEFGFDKWCRTRMRGMSQFYPINRGIQNMLHNIVKPSPSGYVPEPMYETQYHGPDLLPLVWKIPEGHVDLHAIVIATSYEAPQIDHFWEDEGDDDEFEEDAENNRRELIYESTSMERNHDAVRALDSNEVVPGEGWGMYFYGSKTEYCDGSAMSECERIHPMSACYRAGTNDRHDGISGDGLSGWIVFNVPELKEGIIWAKLEWWHPRHDWKLSGDVDGGRRRLGNPAAFEYPHDFKLEIAVNGKIIKTWDKAEFMGHAYPEMAYNNAMYPLVTDETLRGPVELGLRPSSESKPKEAGLSVTHLYYA